MLKLFISSVFQNNRKKALKPYPLSKESVGTVMNSLCSNPNQGDIYPGFTPQLQKLRIPLKEYKIGKSGGLRLLFMIGSKLIVPIILYYKGQYTEHEVQSRAKQALQEILVELQNTSQ